MQLLRSALLPALLLAGLVRAQEFTETFSTGGVPAGWTADPSFNYGNRDYANGRMNIYATDAGLRLLHPLTIPVGATKLVIRYTGSVAFSNIGDSNWVEVRTTGAQQYQVSHGFGDPERATGTMASRVTHNDLNNPAIYSFPGYQQMPKVYDAFSYVVTFEDGQITHQILRGGSTYFQQVVSVPEFHIATINEVGLALYTSTQASIWADDFSVSFSSGPAQLQPFIDAFDSLDTSRWQSVSGSWSVNNGQLTGYWDPGAAQSQQANLLLVGQDTQADYYASFSAVLGNGATGFSLYLNAGNKYNVNVGASGVSVERLANFGNYAFVASGTFPATLLGTGATEVKLVRQGAAFTVFVAGQQITQFTDTVWGGALRLGLRAYSAAVYDAFAFNMPLSACSDCVVLQQALDDALAALAQANAQVTTLTQQLATANADKAALQQQLTQANADKATLQSQLAAANTTIADLQQQLTGAQAQVAQLTSDKAALQQQLTAAQTQIGSLQSANTALQQQLTSAQAQVATLTAQIAQLQQDLAAANANNATLQQQLREAQAQLAAANTQVAQLQQQLLAATGSLGAIDASLAALQANLRQEFSDPNFVIPGATTQAKVKAVINAVIGLNHGRVQGVYQALK